MASEGGDVCIDQVITGHGRLYKSLCLFLAHIVRPVRTILPSWNHFGSVVLGSARFIDLDFCLGENECNAEYSIGFSWVLDLILSHLGRTDRDLENANSC